MNKETRNLVLLAVGAGLVYYYCVYRKKKCNCNGSDSQETTNENVSAYSGLDNGQYEVSGISVPQNQTVGYSDPSAQFAQEALTATTQAQMTTQPFTGIGHVQNFAELNAVEGGFQMY